MRVVAEEGVTVFGTSPAYLQYLQASGRAPSRERDLSRLRAVLSTGSVLYPAQYDWARDNLGEVPVQSISGGTDILGCFVLGNPLLPVYRGEAQCVSLGLDVRAHDGVEARRVGSGELVCVSPIPSRPVGLHGDAGGARLHDTYFSQHEGTWTHGDLVELTERGTVIVRGRSDGVMNLRGIRIGPAEIYSALHEVPEVIGALATDQEWPDEPGGRRLVLLIVLAADVTLDRLLTFRIKKLLKARCSAARARGDRAGARAARDAQREGLRAGGAGPVERPRGAQPHRAPQPLVARCAAAGAELVEVKVGSVLPAL